MFFFRLFFAAPWGVRRRIQGIYSGNLVVAVAVVVVVIDVIVAVAVVVVVVRGGLIPRWRTAQASPTARLLLLECLIVKCCLGPTS